APSTRHFRHHMKGRQTRGRRNPAVEGAESKMPKRQLDALMWAQACAAMERAERLRRQFFHHATPHGEAPIDVFATDASLTIQISLPGVELERVTVSLNTGTLG